ncbi:conserved exported hypothetical protein [Candidatus Desulfarcum epimagneticum]|uniref:Lipoprotein n=1 Tax=uncultured Desulfobacteraceae bacterium TaxID=218296 RepID=A0A484HIJ9_9BACT|nr:conserved exported hypothetical protein [uncultured Desulfobacteraceae bacterium]
MKKILAAWPALIALLFLFGCSTAYKATPLPFKSPAAYGNARSAAGAEVAARAFDDRAEAQKIFGFDIRNAGMLPVQVVFDHQGKSPIEINPTQTFLQDVEGNIWPVLSDKEAYDRTTQYSQTKKIVKKGAYHGMLGAAAGSIIGAAIGIVSNENVLESAGKGAAVGAAAGAVMGGAGGYGEAGDARMEIMDDLDSKSLKNKSVAPGTLAHGIIFFPGEAKSAEILMLQIVEIDTGEKYSLRFPLK